MTEKLSKHTFHNNDIPKHKHNIPVQHNTWTCMLCFFAASALNCSGFTVLGTPMPSALPSHGVFRAHCRSSKLCRLARQTQRPIINCHEKTKKNDIPRFDRKIRKHTTVGLPGPNSNSNSPRLRALTARGVCEVLERVLSHPLVGRPPKRLVGCSWRRGFSFLHSQPSWCLPALTSPSRSAGRRLKRSRRVQVTSFGDGIVGFVSWCCAYTFHGADCGGSTQGRVRLQHRPRVVTSGGLLSPVQRLGSGWCPRVFQGSVHCGSLFVSAQG